MLVSKTPLRMSFAGGGSDLPAFYERRAGAVLSTSIDKYIYVTVNAKFDDGIRLAYSINEEVTKIEDLKHPIAKNALELFNITSGIEITTMADVPSRGTGLGSSSSFTVGILNALSAYQGYGRDKDWLAKMSCHVELDLCNEPIGKQDQYAAAFGGLNVYEFNPDGTVHVIPVVMTRQRLRTLQNNILLFYTGITRSASGILEKQSRSMSNDNQFELMCEMVSQVSLMKQVLEEGSLSDFGRILHEGWLLKRSLSPDISTPYIDDLYSKALKNGALGGKLLGAGAGGFLMIYAEGNCHDAIRNAFADLKEMDVSFDTLGSQIIFNYG